MKKEDLIKLKEKLSELSLEEERLRNLYLRKPIMQSKTGYGNG